ncbi:unnamed protein product [Amoebophrya sp. A120]|nr:unnamed protein product [Amoebophrya sp. A120]|eukprot:GSA120T00001825001.1
MQRTASGTISRPSCRSTSSSSSSVLKSGGTRSMARRGFHATALLQPALAMSVGFYPGLPPASTQMSGSDKFAQSEAMLMQTAMFEGNSALAASSSAKNAFSRTSLRQSAAQTPPASPASSLISLSTYKNYGAATTCLATGAEKVASAEECDSAAVTLGLDRRVGTVKLVSTGELPTGCLYSQQDRMVLFNKDQTDVKHSLYSVVCKTKAPFGATPEPGNDACEADGQSIVLNLANATANFGSKKCKFGLTRKIPYCRKMLYDYGVPVGIHPPPPEAADFEGYFSQNLLTSDLELLLEELQDALVANKTLPAADSIAWYNARILAARDVYSDACQNITGGTSEMGQDWVRLTLSKLHLLVRKIGLQEACQNAPVAKLTPARQDACRMMYSQDPKTKYNLFAMTCLGCLYNEAMDVPNRAATLVRKTPASASDCAANPMTDAAKLAPCDKNPGDCYRVREGESVEDVCMGFAQELQSTKAPGDGGVASTEKQKVTVLLRLKFMKGDGTMIETKQTLMDALARGLADGLSDTGFGAKTRIYMDSFMSLPGGKLFNMATTTVLPIGAMPGTTPKDYTDMTFVIQLDDTLAQGLRQKLNEQDDMVIPSTDYVVSGLKKNLIREINRKFMEAEGPSASVLLDEKTGVEFATYTGFLTMMQKRNRNPSFNTCRKATAVNECAAWQFCNQQDPADLGVCEPCPLGKFRSASDPTLCISRMCTGNDDCPAEAQVCNLLNGSPGVCFNPGGITQGSPCTMQNWKTQCSAIEVCQNSFCVAKCSGPGEIRNADGTACVCRAGWGPAPGGNGCIQGGAGSGQSGTVFLGLSTNGFGGSGLQSGATQRHTYIGSPFPANPISPYNNLYHAGNEMANLPEMPL